MKGNEPLEYFFNARNIALVGVSNKEGKMGNLFLRRIKKDFHGEIYPVHPTEKKILGLTSYREIAAIPSPIDLVVPLIPQEQLLPLVESCANGQVKFLLAIPSGFGELPRGGKIIEKNLVRLAKERGMRVVGPNSLGMFNCLYGLNASMAPELPQGAPGFSCVTQSGGFGMAVTMYAQNHHMQMAKFCDLGNTSDVEINEILEYFCQDQETRIVGIFLESIPDPKRFITETSLLAKKKPLIFTKIGRTPAGGRASFTHIGLPSVGVEGLDRKIIHAHTGLEMLHIAKGLTWQPLPRGRKVGILTGSGGLGAELTDLCIEHGLKVPKFSKLLQKALRPFLPSYASVTNPIDLTPLWWEFPKIYPPLIHMLLSSPEIDLLIITIIDVATTVEGLMHAVVEAVPNGTQTGDYLLKPIYVYWASPHSTLKNMRILEDGHIPCYQSTLETARVAAAISRYGNNVRTAG
ncbi:MAG TPA: hypothetical protein DCZ97_16930 [Syntrophus sp. (in: bacteria)]|nr:hypothetical protein [Syntrophus sp. (in: bacteria)]